MRRSADSEERWRTAAFADGGFLAPLFGLAAGFDAADLEWIHTPEGFYRTPRRCGWELYRLAADPGEREDLGASLDPAPFAAELERLLAKYAFSATLAPPVQPSSALLEQLRAFGYLQGR